MPRPHGDARDVQPLIKALLPNKAKCQTVEEAFQKLAGAKDADTA